MSALLLALTAYLAIQVRATSLEPSSSTVEAAPPGAAPAPTLGATAGAPPEPAAERAPRDRPAPRPTAPEASAAPGAAPGTAPAPAQPSLAAQVAVAANPAFDEANALYDRRDYEEARTLALALLREHPESSRMLRIVVSASCIMGDADVALAHYQRLPAKDRTDMRVRCARYAVALPE